MVEAMKHFTADLPNRPRILTDLSGPMNTMVMEARYASLAAAKSGVLRLASQESAG